jgi:ribosomal protein S27AE
MELAKLVVALCRDDCSIIHRFMPIIGDVYVPFYDDELKINAALATYRKSDIQLAYVAETVGIVYKSCGSMMHDLRQHGLMLIVNIEHMGMISATVVNVPKHAPDSARSWVFSFMTESGEQLHERILMPAKLELFFEKPVWELLDPHIDALKIVEQGPDDDVDCPDDDDFILLWTQKCVECASCMAFHSKSTVCNSCNANAAAAKLLADIEDEALSKERAAAAKAAAARAKKAKAAAKKLRDTPFAISCDQNVLEALGFVL